MSAYSKRNSVGLWTITFSEHHWVNASVDGFTISFHIRWIILTKTKEKYVDIVYTILHCLANIDIFRLEIKIDLVPRFIIYVFRQQLLKILNNVFRFYLTFSIKATDGGVMEELNWSLTYFFCFLFVLVQSFSNITADFHRCLVK